MLYKKISQSEVLPSIIAEINNIYPTKTPRVGDGNKQELVVSITLGYYDDLSVRSSIWFMDGDSRGKTSTDNGFAVDGLIESKTVIQLLTYLLSNFPWVYDMSLNSMGLGLEFAIPMEFEDREGISCRHVTFALEIDIRDIHDKSLNEYLKAYILEIFSHFAEEISNTPTFRAQYREYARIVIKQLLAGLGEEDMIKILELMSAEQLREVLGSVPENLFFELYNQTKPAEPVIIKQMMSGK